MAVDFTPDQRHAIESRASALLVSAAAGSGKTAVLTERVLGLICDPHQPCDITELVIVTFTEAATSEMRSRISSALLERLGMNPTDARLKRQLALLPGARIQTVHSFCKSLLRKYFGHCGLAPDFTIADEAESALIKERALDEVLEHRYAARDPAFEALLGAVCDARGDMRLERAVLELYEQLRSHPSPEQWLAYAAAPEAGGQDVGLQGWGAYLLDMARVRLHYAQSALLSAYDELRDEPVAHAAYGEAFCELVEYAQTLESALDASWDEAYDCLADFVKPTLGQLRRYGNTEFKERMKLARDSFCAHVAYIKSALITMTESEVRRRNDAAQPLCAALCTLVTHFTQVYRRLKDERGLLDFSDLEHYALGLLYDPEKKEPTALARELSSEIREILIDEYQDTNLLQDMIFSAIAPNGGLFFVGDVKQSIYRFRLADPSIFADKYKLFAPYGDPVPAVGRKLSLNRNFRSRGEVLSLCNFIFSRAMSETFGDMAYDESERLYPGAQYEGTCQSELCVIDMKRGSASDEDGEEGEDAPSRVEAEAKYVAARIAQLMRDMPVTDLKTKTKRAARPSDFAILLSAFKNKAGAFERALRAIGIPTSSSDGGESFFGSMEIQIALSILRVISNRRQDIPLISALRSPIWLFTPDELTEIRFSDRDGCLYDALVAHARAGGSKAQRFVDDLEEIARQACDLNAAQLLQRVYAKTGAMGVFRALDGGAARQRNLTRLYEMAAAFESRAARGLDAFLRHMDTLAGSGEGAGGVPAGDAVQLMSIHRAKGLEVPVVFLPDLIKPYNTDELKSPVLFHQHLGIGLTLREQTRNLECKTPMRRAIEARLIREIRAEEIRKLYVAMTRAKEKLVLVCGCKNAAGKLAALAEHVREGRFDPEFVASCNDMASVVLSAALVHPSGGALRAYCGGAFVVHSDAQESELTCAIIPPVAPGIAPRQSSGQTGEEEPDGDFAAALACVEREYAHASAARWPSKLTPTGMRRLLPDAGMLAEENGVRVLRAYHDVPLVAQQGKAAAKRGKAVHRFLELADFAACAKPGGAAREKERLRSSGALDDAQAGAVDDAMLQRVFDEGLSALLADADSYEREVEFSALFSPEELFGGAADEHILMNGAVDLLLRRGDALTIVDFKSDYVLPGEEAQAAQRHQMQLDIYAAALEKITGLRVTGKIVCFVRTAALTRLS